MTDLTSFRSIIALWPSREAMAADVGAPVTAVTKWGQRNNIPSDWWLAVLATERVAAAGVTAELLTTLAARQPISAEAAQ
ncbi:MAG TPA: hypothetical protein VNH44_16895 [Micropepsaceae bacterium]|nr:hypothetical protein [Micropepsaceae bacterium]